MKSMSLIHHPELFQGENKLHISSYFEGWYFKHVTDNNAISFIPGIQIDEKGKSAFIQVVLPDQSYYICYPFSDFSFSHSPFYIRIGDNYFSKEGIHIHIQDDTQSLSITGKITYENITPIHTSGLSPNIMGPFSYLPFMECNHAIISMNHKLFGSLTINGKHIPFDDGVGYIEKDWGTSFPQSYIWCQANQFDFPSTSLFCSIAHIPLGPIHFKGFICVFLYQQKEYRFTTYNGSKVICFNHNMIQIKKGSYLLSISLPDTSHSCSLAAPHNGSMNHSILESITARIGVQLYKQNTIIFSGYSNYAGLEMVTEKAR